MKTTAGQLSVSVVIPTYNAGEALAECLVALLNQSFPAAAYEIIVVDDGSTDSPADRIRSLPRGEDVKYFYQANQGPAGARNRGARLARGEIVVFTDSDCVPGENFIEQIFRSFSDNPEIAGVMGAYRTRQRSLVGRFAQVEFENRYRKLARHRYIDFVATYAAAFRRKIFLELGGFDPNFPVANNEDVEFSYRLAEQGGKMVFNPGAIVYHRHPETVFDYLKSKFGRAYWRMQVYKLHPGKALKDSYTPQVLKFQIFLSGLIVISLLYFLATGRGLYLLLILAGSFLVTALPFLFSLFQLFRFQGQRPVPASRQRGPARRPRAVRLFSRRSRERLLSAQDCFWRSIRRLLKKTVDAGRLVLSSSPCSRLREITRKTGRIILGFLNRSAKLAVSGILSLSAAVAGAFRRRRKPASGESVSEPNALSRRFLESRTVLALFSPVLAFLRGLSMGFGILIGLASWKKVQARFRHSILLIAADALALFTATYLTHHIRAAVVPRLSQPPGHFFLRFTALYFSLFAIVFALSSHQGLYRPAEGFSSAVRSARQSKNLFFAAIILLVFLSLIGGQYAWLTAGIFWVCATLTFWLFRALVDAAIRGCRFFQLETTRILIVGTGEMGQIICKKFSSHLYPDHTVVGFCSPEDPRGEALPCLGPESPPILGTAENLSEIISRFAVTEVYIALPDHSQEYILEMINKNSSTGTRYHILSSLFGLLDSRANRAWYSDLPITEIRNSRPGIVHSAVKRVFDLLLSIMLLLVTLPLWLGIIIAIKIESDGPAIFRQERVGRNGIIFKIFKFRTMHNSVEKYQYAPADPGDKRITRVGRFLRRSSLDELPQLLNVIRGDMSLVGPRPEMVFLVEKYRDWEKARLTVKPGLTGIWQILGRKDLPLHQNLEYDFYYIRNQNLMMDLTILLQTIPVIFARKGAF